MYELSKNNFLKKNDKGQSTVEYILLLVVITFLMLTIVRSSAFQEFIGEDSNFFRVLRERFIYSYRHGRDGLDPGDNYPGGGYSGTSHDSYEIPGSGSRFVTGTEPYGQ